METEKEIIRIRNHFTYIFEKMWGVLILLLAMLVGDEDAIVLGMQLIRSGNVIQGLLMMGGAIGVILIICLWFVNRWYRTTFTVKEGTVVYERATLKRYVNNISIANISNINLEQNLFEMVVGTYKLKIDTNSLSTADSTDLEIVLKKKDAQRIKKLIFTMMQENQEGASKDQRNQLEETGSNSSGVYGQPLESDFDDEWEAYDIVYSIREIIKNCFISISILQVIVVVCFLVSTICFTVVSIHEGVGIPAAISTMFGFVIGTGTVIVTMVKKASGDYDFRAKRDKNKIYVSCGLFKKKKYVVPVDKINAVSLKYTFIGRLCKRAYVKVINVGGEKEEADGVKILLADKYEELERNMKILLPEYELPEIKCLKRPPKRSFGMKILYSTIVVLLFLAGFFIGIWSVTGESVSVSVFVPVIVGAGLILLLWILICYLTYRTAGLSHSDSQIILSRGTFGRTIQSISYDKIQFMSVRQGPVQRKLGLCKGNLSILATVSDQTQAIGCYAKEDFDLLEKNFYSSYHAIEKR